MREPGFYWVKYKNKWQVAECIKWFPTISDGNFEMRWLLIGKKRERVDADFTEIHGEKLTLSILRFTKECSYIETIVK